MAHRGGEKHPSLDPASGLVEGLTRGGLSGRATLEALRTVVPELAKALGPDHEVVVHDVALIPNSIIAIGGSITGRTVGGPITDLLLRALRHGETDSIFRYQTRTQDDRLLSSSTVFIKDDDGTLVGCLCVNRDITEVAAMGEFWERVIGGAATRPPAQRGPAPVRVAETEAPTDASPAPTLPLQVARKDTPESFAPTVEDLAVTLVSSAIADTGVPVDLMQKRHKLQVVAELDARGLFLLRDAVDFTATMLQVSRESVYGYLKECRAEDQAGSQPRGRGGRGRTAESS